MLYITDEEKQDLIDSVDISELLDDLGIERKKVGSHYSILCPCPNHIDKRRGNCIVYPHNVYCYGCGKSYDAIGLVSQTMNIDTYESVCYLAEFLNRADEFEQRGKRHKPVHKHYQSLDDDALKFIGLCLDENDCYSPIAVSRQRENNCRRDLDGYYKVEPFQKPRLSHLKEDEPEVYQWLVNNKASEMDEKLDNLILCLTEDAEFRNQISSFLDEIGCDIQELIRAILSQKNKIKQELKKLLN